MILQLLLAAAAVRTDGTPPRPSIHHFQIASDEPGPWRYEGTTLEGVNNASGTCGGNGGADANDVVFEFTAPFDGSYTFLTEGDWDTLLYVRTFCGLSLDELACNDDANGSQSELVVDLTAGQTVYPVVDGFGSASGDFALVVDIMVP